MKKKIIFLIWSFSILAGFISLYHYEFTPGADGKVSESLPQITQFIKKTTPYLLLIFIHPHCPCSRASLHELEIIMSKTIDKMSVIAFFVQPSSFDEEWVKTKLWYTAEAMSGMDPKIDFQGKLAKRLGVTTSGQTLLYNSSGQLLFNGGITGSRGHEGSNLGATSIIDIVQGNLNTIHTTPYFGCPLFSQSSIRKKNGKLRCYECGN